MKLVGRLASAWITERQLIFQYLFLRGNGVQIVLNGYSLAGHLLKHGRPLDWFKVNIYLKEMWNKFRSILRFILNLHIPWTAVLDTKYQPRHQRFIPLVVGSTQYGCLYAQRSGQTVGVNVGRMASSGLSVRVTKPIEQHWTPRLLTLQDFSCDGNDSPSYDGNDVSVGVSIGVGDIGIECHASWDPLHWQYLTVVFLQFWVSWASAHFPQQILAWQILAWSETAKRTVHCRTVPNRTGGNVRSHPYRIAPYRGP